MWVRDEPAIASQHRLGLTPLRTDPLQATLANSNIPLIIIDHRQPDHRVSDKTLYTELYLNHIELQNSFTLRRFNSKPIS